MNIHTRTVVDHLTDWRQRRLGRPDLACEEQISASHLTFVEIRRSRTGRATILDLYEQLQIRVR